MLPIQVEKQTRYRGMQRRIVGYIAKLGDIESEIQNTPINARAALETKIEAACRYAAPMTVNVRGMAAFVGANRGEWYYVCARNYADAPDRIARTPSQVMGFATGEDAAFSALVHGAQITWAGTAEDGETLAALLEAESAHYYAPPDAAQRVVDFREWVAWQLRYQEARNAGASDMDAHRAASARTPYVPAA